MNSRELFVKGQKIHVSNKGCRVLSFVHTFIEYDNDMIVAKGPSDGINTWFHAVPAIVRVHCDVCNMSIAHNMIGLSLKCRICGNVTVLSPNYIPTFEEPPSCPAPLGDAKPFIPDPPNIPEAGMPQDHIKTDFKPTKPDMVNKPPHYRNHPSGVECIQITEHMGFNIGNAMKYLWRADEKHNDGGMEDLKKAQYYVNRELAKRGANNE